MAKRTAKERVLTEYPNAHVFEYRGGWCVCKGVKPRGDAGHCIWEIGFADTVVRAWADAASRLASARD